ncbi:MAG: hypothetical protein J4432_05070 [DPANN group archaeon]|nr:hypothetical protein [DPANN group archaeon]
MTLITTSRKPVQNTRTFSKALGALLPMSEYKARGKSALETIIEYAGSRGHGTVIIIEEKNGNPKSIRSLKIHNHEWDWQPRYLEILGYRLVKKSGPVKDIEVLGSSTDAITELFGIESTDAVEVSLKAEDNELVFAKNDEQLMKVRIKIQKMEV